MLRTLRPRIAAALSRVRPPKKTVDPVYLTIEWRSLVAELIRRRGRRCERCGRTHDQQGKPVRIFGDHIKELKDGGPLLDGNNIELLCGSCHKIKSNAERSKRMAINFRRNLTGGT